MVAVVDFTVRSYDQDFLDLFWTFGDAPGKVSRYHVYVDRSVDAPGGPWSQIAGPFFNTGHFRDGDVSLFHTHRRYYYKLRVLDPETGDEKEFGPYTAEPKADLVTQEIRRHFNLRMREFEGRLLLVFPRITKGFKCPTCTKTGDDGRGTGRKRSQNCVDCFDTTYVSGYGQPIAVYGQISPEQKSQQNTDLGTVTQEQTQAKMPFFPPLKPGDMIVEVGENKRWEVQPNVGSPKKGRAVTHQEPTLQAIPLSDIRYKVPVHVDPSVDPNPYRENERRMCLPEEEDNVAAENLGYWLDSLTGHTSESDE